MTRGRPGRPRLSDTPSRVASRRRYAELVRAKRCAWGCGQRAASGRLCVACADVSARSQLERAQKLVAIGRCRRCARDSRGRHLCPACARKRAAQPSRTKEYRVANEYKRHGRGKKAA